MNRHVPPQIEDDARARFAPRSAPDFRRATRHSARVRWIRRLLPALVLVALVLIAAGAFISRMGLKVELPFDMGHLTLAGSRLTMELPKLSGFTDDNRGYTISAKTASQDLTNPDVIELADIHARLELADKGWATVEAAKGAFDTKRQTISLDNGVDLAMNGGYGGHLKNAAVDVKGGSIVTEEPVVFTYLDGRLVADRLTVSDRGQKALFLGNVQLDFRLSNLPKGSDAKAGEVKAGEVKPAESPASETRLGDGPSRMAPRPPAAAQPAVPSAPKSTAPNAMAPNAMAPMSILPVPVSPSPASPTPNAPAQRSTARP